MGLGDLFKKKSTPRLRPPSTSARSRERVKTRSHHHWRSLRTASADGFLSRKRPSSTRRKIGNTRSVSLTMPARTGSLFSRCGPSVHAGLPADRRSHVLPQVARSNSEVDHDVEQALKRIIARLRGARDITRKRLPARPKSSPRACDSSRNDQRQLPAGIRERRKRGRTGTTQLRHLTQLDSSRHGSYSVTVDDPHGAPRLGPSLRKRFRGDARYLAYRQPARFCHRGLCAHQLATGCQLPPARRTVASPTPMSAAMA
jgi:hypothetical protein